ncbi:LysE family translocator [Desulforhopalus sp. 52FAK]
MQPVETLSLFFATSLLLALTPGPDNLFVLAQAAQRGKLAGLIVTAGLSTGVLFHTLGVALGAAALFSASALAFNLLKYIGAAYLLYLAFQAWKAGRSSVQQGGEAPPGVGKLYLRGVIMNITNPKVSIFFLAFLPQFTDPALGQLLPQFLILGVLFVVSTLLIFGTISLVAGWLGAKLRSSEKPEQILNRVAGTVFLGLAIKLVLTKQ